MSVLLIAEVLEGQLNKDSTAKALTAAAQTGAPVIPLFIADDEVSTLGAAPKWRFGLGVAEFGKELAKIGSRLILRSGNPLDVLSDVISETGAKSVLQVVLLAHQQTLSIVL